MKMLDHKTAFAILWLSLLKTNFSKMKLKKNKKVVSTKLTIIVVKKSKNK